MDRRATPSGSNGDDAPPNVGQGAYVVRAGECFGSIAHEHGFFWETIWNLPENEALKRVRQSPFVLLEGDRITIPSLRQKQESGATEQRHRFQRKGVPAELEVVLTELVASEPAPADYTTQAEGRYETPEPTILERRPIANTDYTLDIDGVLTSGRTDSSGKIKTSIPPNARRGRVLIRVGQPDQLVIPLALGHLDPADTWPGIAQRLRNLGYAPGAVGTGKAEGATPPGLVESIKTFQSDRSMTPDGRVDASLIDRLKQAHGS